MKYIFIALLFIFTSCKAQVQPLRIADDSVYAYHHAVADKATGQPVGTVKDETVKFYFYNGQSATQMYAIAIGDETQFVFDVDSILVNQRDSVGLYFGVVGKLHINSTVEDAHLLIITELHGKGRQIYLFVKENVFVFYN